MARYLSRTTPRTLAKSRWALGFIFGAGPPGALLFIDPKTTDTISVPAEIIAQLSAGQQSYFTGETWDDYATFYAAVSAEDWFNVSTMGTLAKGIAFYPSDATQRTLNRGLVWFGYDPVVVYWQRVDESNILRTDETPIEVRG